MLLRFLSCSWFLFVSSRSALTNSSTHHLVVSSLLLLPFVRVSLYTRHLKAFLSLSFVKRHSWITKVRATYFCLHHSSPEWRLPYCFHNFKLSFFCSFATGSIGLKAARVCGHVVENCVIWQLIEWAVCLTLILRSFYWLWTNCGGNLHPSNMNHSMASVSYSSQTANTTDVTISYELIPLLILIWFECVVTFWLSHCFGSY